LHRINSLEEAFEIRAGKIKQILHSNLLQKKDQLLAQIHRIEYRIEEIKYVKTIIERDIRSEYSGIMERLNSAEGLKLAVLHHEISELQKDLDKINDLGKVFKKMCESPDNYLNFLLRSRNLYENIEYMLSKPFKGLLFSPFFDLGFSER